MKENVKFTHTGIFCGCVPVLIRNPYGECLLEARYFLPNFMIDILARIYDFVSITIGNDDGWPLKITGIIE